MTGSDDTSHSYIFASCPWWGYGVLFLGIASTVLAGGFLFGTFTVENAYWVDGGSWGMGLLVLLALLIRISRCGSLGVGFFAYLVLVLGVLGIGHATFYIDERDEVAAAIRAGEVPSLSDQAAGKTDKALFREYARLHLGEDAEGGFFDHLRLVALRGAATSERIGWPRGPWKTVLRKGWEVWVGWLGQGLLLMGLPIFGLLLGWVYATAANERLTAVAAPSPTPKFAVRESTARAKVSIRPFMMKDLFVAFAGAWWRFSGAGLVTLTALTFAPRVHQDIFIWLFVSGIYISAAADVLARDPATRETFNLNRLTSHFIGLAFPGSIAFLLLLPVLAIPGFFTARAWWTAAVLTALGLLAIVLGFASRLWPAYVTPWLYRGWGKADVWRESCRWNPMVTDWPLAWQMTRLAGADRAATLPALGLTFVVLTFWASMRAVASGSPWLVTLLDILMVFLLWPLLVLVVLDRAQALRDAALKSDIASEKAFAARMPRAEHERPPATELDKALYAACRKDDSKAAVRHLRAGADPNHWTPQSAPLLVDLAGKSPSTTLLESLLRYGADPNVADEGGTTPLHVAAIHNDAKQIELLLRHGADPRRKDRDGNTPVDHATRFGGRRDSLEALLSATGERQDPEGIQKLFLAAIGEGDLLAVERFLQEPALPEGGAERIEAVHLSAMKDDPGILRRLLDAGYPVDGSDRNGDLPLHTAARDGKVEAVRLLLERGASPDVVNRGGALPLYLALTTRRAGRETILEMAEHLLKAGSPRRFKAPDGDTLRAAVRARGLDELLAALPKEPDEPPMDPSAKGVGAVHLYDDGKTRVSYSPNDIRYPFIIAHWEGRDGWVPELYGSARFQELRGRLAEFGLEWLDPVINSWASGRPMPLSEVIEMYTRETGRPPVIKSMEEFLGER